MRKQHPYGNRYVAGVVFVSLMLTSMGCARQDEISRSDDRSKPSGEIAGDTRNQRVQPSLDKEDEELSKDESTDEAAPVAAVKDDEGNIAQLRTGHSPTPESLKDVFTRWQEMMLDDDADTRVAAVEVMLPRREDIERVVGVFWLWSPGQCAELGLHGKLARRKVTDLPHDDRESRPGRSVHPCNLVDWPVAFRGFLR